MSKIQARAKVKITFGMLEDYKRYVLEYINQIKEKDSGTLQFDWFISNDKTEAEIQEVYESSEAALKHQEQLGELQGIIFKRFGAPYSITSSDGTAAMQCVNPGGNSPAPKKVDSGLLQGQAVFIQPRNGQIIASVTLGPPALPVASQVCPNSGWSIKIVSLTYDNVVLHNQQNGVDILTFNFGEVDP